MSIRPYLLSLLFVYSPVALPQNSPAQSVADTAGTQSAKASEEQPVGEEASKPVVSETMIVTATRSARAVSELPVSATVLSEEDVRMAPTLEVDDYLRTIPGVTIPLASSAQGFFEGNRFSMHGLGGTRALMLLDGVPMHDPYFGVVQWQKAQMGQIEQIEVVRGGSASLFGNYALGGAVSIITKPVQESQVTLDTSYGSFGTGRLNLNVDQMITPRFGLRLSHDRFNTNGYHRVVPEFRGAIDIPAWADIETTSLRSDFQFGNASRGWTKTSWSSFDMSQGTPVADALRDLFNASVGIQHAVGTNALLSANVFHERQKVHIHSNSTTATRATEFLSADSRIPIRDLGASLEWSLNRAGAISLVSFGLDLHRTTADESRKTLNAAGAQTQLNVVHGRQEFAGLFGQVSWRPSSKIEVLTSARFDYYRNLDGSESPSPGTPTAYPKKISRELDPRLSVRYALAPRTAVRASVYRAFKAPTLRDLYRTSQAGRLIIRNNPNLDPEILTGGEAGIEWSGNRARFEVNLFRSEISNVLVRMPVTPGIDTVVRPENLGVSVSQGVEFMADIQILPSLSATLGYALADSTFTDNPPDRTIEGNQVPEVPLHLGTIGLRYRHRSGFNGLVRTRIVSRTYDDPANTLVLPAHRVVDVNLAHPIREGLELYVIAENVLDEKYVVSTSGQAQRPGEPRMVSLGVRLRVPTGSLFSRSMP